MNSSEETHSRAQKLTDFDIALLGKSSGEHMRHSSGVSIASLASLKIQYYQLTLLLNIPFFRIKLFDPEIKGCLEVKSADNIAF